MATLFRGTRLQVSIAALFAALILPALGAIIAFSYYANERTLRDMSQGFMDRARDDAVASVAVLLDPVVSALRIVAAVETNEPGYFRSDTSGDVLYRALQGVPQMDAIYTSFDDGYHRVVTRIDEDRRKSDPRIPSVANWHMSWIGGYDPLTPSSRMRHRTFYATWPEVIERYDTPWSFDIRTLPHYVAAHDKHAVAVSEPQVNPDTGAPIIGVGYPIERDGLVVGVASANLTMGMLSEFLSAHRASPNAITVIANRRGTMIAHPDTTRVVRREGGKLVVAKIDQLADAPVVAAAAERARRGEDRFTFTTADGTEYAALFSPIPGSAAWDWEIAVVAPTDDFVGALRRTSQLLILLMVGIALVESLLIHFMARIVSRPIEIVSGNIEKIRSLSFAEDTPTGSLIREIGYLQRAVVLLNNALHSFAAFVPVDVVRGLIESGRPLTPGVEHRFLTILFSDVEGFTTLSEALPPQQLSEQT